jgi:hypothetical protein
VNVDNNRVTLKIDAAQGGILSVKNRKSIVIKPGFSGKMVVDYVPGAIPLKDIGGFNGGGPIF